MYPQTIASGGHRVSPYRSVSISTGVDRIEDRIDDAGRPGTHSDAAGRTDSTGRTILYRIWTRRRLGDENPSEQTNPWTPTHPWTPYGASYGSERLRVFVEAMTEDFLHSEAVDMVEYYSRTLGLDTRWDLLPKAERLTCTKGPLRMLQ